MPDALQDIVFVRGAFVKGVRHSPAEPKGSARAVVERGLDPDRLKIHD
jgi:hypothetical protein